MITKMQKRLADTNRKGFTLIELIVVIAILAILAAILVPSMVNYIKNANDSVIKSDCRTAYSAASSAYAAIATDAARDSGGSAYAKDESGVAAYAKELFGSSKYTITVTFATGTGTTGFPTGLGTVKIEDNSSHKTATYTVSDGSITVG